MREACGRERDREQREGQKKRQNDRAREKHGVRERWRHTYSRARGEASLNNCFSETEPYFVVPQLCSPRKANIAAENLPTLLTVNNSLFILPCLGFYKLNFIQAIEQVLRWAEQRLLPEEECREQRALVTCSSSHSKLMAKLGPRIKTPDSHVHSP